MWDLRRRFIGRFDLTPDHFTFSVNGHPQQVLPNIINISFPGLSSDTLLMNLDMAGIAASSGSACSAGSLEPSHVLAAMGLPEERLRSAIRFSLGYGHTPREIEEAAARVADVVMQTQRRAR